MGRKYKKPVDENMTQPDQTTPETQPEENGSGRKEKDTSNPPFYVIMGKHPNNGTTVIVWREETIGRIRKQFKNVVQGFGGVYDNLHICRVKRILDTEMVGEE